MGTRDVRVGKVRRTYMQKREVHEGMVSRIKKMVNELKECNIGRDDLLIQIKFVHISSRVSSIPFFYV